MIIHIAGEAFQCLEWPFVFRLMGEFLAAESPTRTYEAVSEDLPDQALAEARTGYSGVVSLLVSH